MYTFEIYVSIVWDSVTRIREQQVNVAYTTELDDELFSDRGYKHKFQSPSELRTGSSDERSRMASSSWLCGWNFTTDLYRILEHVITNFRDRKRVQGLFPTHLFVDHSMDSVASIRDTVMQLYTDLPPCFKEASKVTCDAAR